MKQPDTACHNFVLMWSWNSITNIIFQPYIFTITMMTITTRTITMAHFLHNIDKRNGDNTSTTNLIALSLPQFVTLYCLSIIIITHQGAHYDYRLYYNSKWYNWYGSNFDFAVEGLDGCIDLVYVLYHYIITILQLNGHDNIIQS